MKESPSTNLFWSPSRISTIGEGHKRSRKPWNHLLRFLTTAPQVSGLPRSISPPHSRSAGYFLLSRYPRSLALRWPCTTKTRTNAMIMGGSNSTGPQSQPKQQEHGQNVPKPSETMELSRDDYDELLLQYQSLDNISAAQRQEIASYRRIISETRSDEMSHRMDEVQNKLRELSVRLDLVTNENSKMFHANYNRSQHKVSMRENLDRLSRTLLIVTEENKALKEGHRLMADSLTELETEESDPTAESGEQVRSGISTIHRKKASSNLRSEEINGHSLQPKALDEQLMHSQEPPTDGPLAVISEIRTKFLALQSKARSAETHIINIGGNLGALIPQETVKNEFTSLMSAIQIWVTNSISPFISNAEQCFQASERARNNRAQGITLGISRVRNQYFRAASEFRGVDESIFFVMIFDILFNQIFSAKVWYANKDLQRKIDVIKQLEPSMELSSDSSRKRLYNSRRWKSEAMTAILAREETQAVRHDFSHVLAISIVRAIGLADVLGPNNQNALLAATTSVRQDVVLPAIELGDMIARAIDKYSWSDPCILHTQFFDDLGNLDCKNFGDGPPRFRLEKMQKKFSDNEIRSQLRAICPAIPALTLTEVDDTAWGPLTILVKSQVWVSWQDNRTGTQRPKGQGFFWFLYNREAGPPVSTAGVTRMVDDDSD